MYKMFNDAESLKQNLCAWGEGTPNVNKQSMFLGTACEDKTDDNWCVNCSN